MKNLLLYNVSIYLNFYQDKFINECARNILAKITESQNHGYFFVGDVEEFRFFKMVY